MWAICLRSYVNHCGAHTTGLCEGYHSGLKSVMRAEGGEANRLDSLIHHLLKFVSQQLQFKDIQKYARAYQHMEHPGIAP